MLSEGCIALLRDLATVWVVCGVVLTVFIVSKMPEKYRPEEDMGDEPDRSGAKTLMHGPNEYVADPAHTKHNRGICEGVVWPDPPRELMDRITGKWEGNRK